VKTRIPKKQYASRTATVERVMKFAEKKDLTVKLEDQNGTITDGAAANPLCLCVVPQGATANSRIGRRIVIRSIYLTGRMHTPVALTGFAHFRVIIFQDRTPNSALPTIAALMLENHILSPLNLGNTKRFKVLADERLGGQMFSGETNGGMVFDRYIKTNIEVGFVPGTGANDYTDVLTNGIYVLVFAGGSTAATAPPMYDLYWRIRYVDM